MSFELLIIPLSGLALGGAAFLFNKFANKPSISVSDQIARAAELEVRLVELRSEIDAIKGAHILGSITRIHDPLKSFYQRRLESSRSDLTANTAITAVDVILAGSTNVAKSAAWLEELMARARPASTGVRRTEISN